MKTRNLWIKLTGINDSVHVIEQDEVSRWGWFVLEKIRLICDQGWREDEKFPTDAMSRNGLVGINWIVFRGCFNWIEYGPHDHRVGNLRMLDFILDDIEYWRLKWTNEESNCGKNEKEKRTPFDAPRKQRCASLIYSTSEAFADWKSVKPECRDLRIEFRLDLEKFEELGDIHHCSSYVPLLFFNSEGNIPAWW